MKQLHTTLSVFILITILISCSKGEDPKIQSPSECFFEQIDGSKDGLIDDVERGIMIECIEHSLTSKNDIEANLIGEWSLIGYGEGSFASNSKPCGYITITSDELIFELRDNFVDTTITTGWEIEEVNIGLINYFKLTNDSDLHGLGIRNFCDKYMFEDSTDSHGNMYLYEKVE